ncbi:SDR family oxidoreductase [Aquabacterium sp. A7-Y]|uniref:SDR family oxidoreductase n=1 Tax=Aquabacterium sp. A7-Y TaxID=1349605 RepID=UPI00223DC0F6|nr:SDR family oxidoreductase [Aquabacterium sp. A7-Y]MCW7539811.1 SDR family oxidoreductase [Aquabacterium sp. A7-Y]
MPQDKKTLPPQHQDVQPGHEGLMDPPPASDAEGYVGSGKLRGKVAIVTGGDSGIGRSVAICFAKEGADVVIVYLNEHQDAAHTIQKVEAQQVRCLALAGDLGEESFAEQVLRSTLETFGRIDVLVNNAAEQHPREKIEDISASQLEQTFRTNFFSMFNLSRLVVPHLPEGGSIVNTTSVTAYRGSAHLLDYASSKGAIVAFTRSLAQQLAKRKIRVNAVAPGPVWTPLIPSTFDEDEVESFGAKVPMARPGQPDEISPSYVFLASRDASYMTGQVLHPNGGEVING